MSTGNELVKLRQVNVLYKDLRERSAPIITESVSGNPIIFNDGADGLPLSECKLTLLPRQSGSGDASPQNIRPLIPWENVGTWTSRANTWNEQWEVGTISIETGENVVANDRIRAKDYNPCVPNKTYFIVDPTHGKNIRLFYYDGEKNFVGDSGWKDSEIVTPSNAYFFRFIVAASYGTEYKNDIAINYPSNVTTYAPATSHPVDLTGITPPVYGCEIHLTTGEVWGTHVLWTKNTASMDNDAIYPGWKNAGIRNIVGIEKGGAIDAMLNVGNVVAINTRNANDIVYLPFSFYSKTQDEWIALAIDVQVALPLETPVLLATLTPQEIETLLGTNTIWSDADSIDMEYRADTELFINQNGVKDVQVNGTSVATDGVANVPIAGLHDFGVVKVDPYYGITKTENNNLRTNYASVETIKLGGQIYAPLVPYTQHASTFYGLAKAAGEDMAQSSNAVGTYTDAAKQAIQKLFGLAGLLGPYEDDITADRPYAIGETFVMDGKRYKATAAITQGGIITPGTNCELDPLDGRYVRNTDYATNQKAGVVKVQPSEGLAIYDSSKILYVNCADSNTIKAEESYTRAIVPRYQYAAVFYGLAKAAGEDMKTSSNPIGTYTAEAKAAIQSMLGIEADIPLVETVSGSTPSITGMPNVRYICGTCSTLAITPPSAGSIVVRFDSGSSPTILTVPSTVKFPAWFDYTALEANTTYELIITDGVYGGAMAWAD